MTIHLISPLFETEFVSHYRKTGSPAPVPCGSYNEAIEHKDVKAVYVALPTSLEEEVSTRFDWHVFVLIKAHKTKIVLQALAAGKHVLADKPFVSASSVERMSRAAHEKGLLFMDATHFVHCARTALIKEKLTKGVIGTVQHLLCNFYAGASLPEDNIRFDPRLE
jgi:predicted dehydrogenase